MVTWSIQSLGVALLLCCLWLCFPHKMLSAVAIRFSLSHVLVSLFWFVLFSFTFCVFLCSLVNSSVSMFYTLVVLLFVSLMSIRLFYSFLFHYYFSVCSLCSLFLLFSLYFQFLFLYAKFNHLWYPFVWVQITFPTVPWSVALSNHFLIVYLFMSFMLPRVGWATSFPISSAGPHGCADISAFA